MHDLAIIYRAHISFRRCSRILLLFSELKFLFFLWLLLDACFLFFFKLKIIKKFRVGGYFDAEEVFLRLGCSVTPARHVEAGDKCRIFHPKGVESYVFT